MDLLLAPFYKWIILVLLIFLGAFAWSNKSLKAEISQKDIECTQKVEDAVKPFKDAEKAAQDKAYEASEEYEESRHIETKHTEIINTKVEKVIERIPVDGVCFGDDGVSVVNEAATAAATSTSNTSEPEATMSETKDP